MLLVPVLAFFCLFSAVITYGLGIFVFAKSPASAENRLFLAAMLAGAYWASGEFMIWQATGYEEVRFWLRASAFWPLAVAFLLHFILAFTRHAAARKENRAYLFLFLYIPATIFSLLGIFTDLVYAVRYQPEAGYIYLPVSGSPAFQATTAFIVVVMAYAISVGLASWIRAGDEKLRRQNFLVTLGIIVVVVSGALSGLILPACGIYLPNLVFIGVIIFSLIITYAIVQHHLFMLSPETAVPDILRTMPDGLILADMNDRIVAANTSAAMMTGIDSRALHGRPAATIIPQPAYRSIRAAVLAEETVAEFETGLAPDHGKVVSIAGSLVKDPSGKPAGIVLIIHDITHRKEQERALRKAGEKLSLLNQLTRHDISNLVTALGNYLSLLHQKPTSDPVVKQYLSSSLDILDTISDHLRFSREYQEIGIHEPLWQSLDQMITRAAGDLAAEGVAITKDAAPVEIFSDPLSSRVIYNLLENAVRHGGHVTKIRLTTQEYADGALALVIEDDGTGVKEEEKEKIFERGYGKNTGLGLTLSREILAVTGISISENGQSGSGARFEIRIPPSAWRASREER